MKKTKIKLELLSPVHIGTGEKLRRGIDFWVHRDTCYFIDVKKLTAELRDKGCGDEYVTAIRERGLNTMGFLREHQIALQKVVKEYHSMAKFHLRGKTIYPFKRDPLGEPYIPGSAIKGAIRTAVLWKMVREDKSDRFVTQGYEVLRKKLPPPGAHLTREEKERIKSEIGSFLNPEFLQDYAPEGGERDAHTDILRALGVSDTLPVAPPNSLEIKPVKMISLGDEGNGRGWHPSHLKVKGKVIRDWKTGKPVDIDIYAECMVPTKQRPIEMEVKVKIDEMILDDLQPQSQSKVPPWCRSLEGIMDVCQEFTDFCIKQEEMGFYQELKGVDKMEGFYKKERPNLRIGWGSGLAETTILSLLPPDIRQRVQGIFNGASGPKFPKTRRVIVEGKEPSLPLGWMRLEM